MFARDKTAFEAALAPVDTAVSGKLRASVAAAGDNAHQVLRDITRSANLVARPGVARALAAECDALLARITAQVEAMDAETDSRMRAGRKDGGGKSGASARNLSPVVSNVVWAAAMTSKIGALFDGAQRVLGSRARFAELKSLCSDLRAKLEAWQSDLFATWRKDTEEALEDGKLQLEMSGRVMEFDVAGNMTVNYSERLVGLLRDTRQLLEMRLAVPEKIRNAAKNAERYYRFGVCLTKVANFYNTLGSEILKTQKPMLLDKFSSFEKEVADPGKGDRKGKIVTWSDPEQCQEFVERLQGKADALAAENRRLRALHMKLTDDIVAFMNIDLLRQRDLWKTRRQEILDVVTTLQHTIPSERMHRWLQHWDRQWYKALEAGYKMGLESLNENLPEMKAQIEFTQRELRYRPPLEELRASFYRETKRFISIPSTFAGFGSAGAQYALMADRNPKSLVQVYRKAEILFARLSRELEKLQPWVAVGKISDLDAFVDANVVSVVDYDTNLKMLKTKRKEADGLPDFVKVRSLLLAAAMCARFKACLYAAG